MLLVAGSSLAQQAPPPPVIVDEGPLGPDRLWIGVGLLLGWSERSRVPETFTFPATGDTLSFPKPKKPVVAAGTTLQGGFWFGESLQHGVDASFLNLGNWYEIRSNSSNASPAELETRYGTGDVNYRHRIYQAPGVRIDGLVGYRYAGLRDTTQVTNRFIDPRFGTVRFRDTAEAWNDFNGGQLGLAGVWDLGPWMFSGTAKIALGGTHSEIDYHGASTVFANMPDGVNLLSEDRFAVLPSVSLMLSRTMWGHSRFYVGYEFQYLSQVARSADAFNDVRPSYKSHFWAQGVTLGIEWRY